MAGRRRRWFGYYSGSRNAVLAPHIAVETDDAATVYVKLTPSATHEYDDAATVYINISNTGGECYSTFSADYFGEGDANLQWNGDTNLQFTGDANLQWIASFSIGEAIHC